MKSSWNARLTNAGQGFSLHPIPTASIIPLIAVRGVSHKCDHPEGARALTDAEVEAVEVPRGGVAYGLEGGYPVLAWSAAWRGAG